MDVIWYWLWAKVCIIAAGLVIWFVLVISTENLVTRFVLAVVSIVLTPAILVISSYYIQRQFGYPIAHLNSLDKDKPC